MKKYLAGFLLALSMPFAVFAAEGETKAQVVEEVTVTPNGIVEATPPAVVVQDDYDLGDKLMDAWKEFEAKVADLMKGDKAVAEATKSE